MQPAAMARAAAAMADAGANYVKVGLYPHAAQDDCVRALSSLARRVSLIGVTFADHRPNEALIALMAESGFAGAMIDTARKNSGRLLDHMDIAAIGNFVESARTRGLLAGLAGSLETPDIPRLLLLAPDVLGFRRALCAGQDRTARLDADAVDVVRALIPVGFAQSQYRRRGFRKNRLPAAGGARLFVRSPASMKPNPIAFSCATSCCLRELAPTPMSGRSRKMSASTST